MANPNKEALDLQQILSGSYDSVEERLRVDAEVTATIGTVEVIINASSGDNIAISDGTNTVGVTPDGELKVHDEATAELNDKLVNDYGVSDEAIRTASQIGNTDGEADFNTGPSTDQTLRATSNSNDGSGNPLTSTLYSGQRTLHTQSPDNFTTSVNLNAFNPSASISLQGLNSVGCQINSGLFMGTIVAEASIDGGSNWTLVPFYDPVNSSVLTNITFVGINTTRIVSIIPIGGSSDIRVRVNNYLSGIASVLLRAANVSGASGAITSAAFSLVVNSVVQISNNSPILVLAANPTRKYAYFGNNSGSTVRLQFSSSSGLSSATGIPVQSQTGFYELKGDNLFTGDVYAFCSSDVELSVTEGTP